MLTPLADKYTQISRILCPIVQTIRFIDKNAQHPRHGPYFSRAFGGAQRLQQDILFDFFRNAFDGSGADNFFDAGASVCVPVSLCLCELLADGTLCQCLLVAHTVAHSPLTPCRLVH
jgi:hypothetical protein